MTSRSPRQAPLVVVVGGSDPLGRSVVRHLVLSEYRVRIFDSYQVMDMQGLAMEFRGGTPSNREALLSAFQDAHAVIHLKILSDVEADYADLTAMNVEGTRNVLDACRQCGVRKLVFLSSPYVVMTNRDIENGDEDLPYANPPLDRFAATMQAAERMVLAANGKDGLLTCALRCSKVFSAGSQLFRDIVLAARDDELQTIIGDESVAVDFTFVDNAAVAFVLAVEHLRLGRADGRAYFITNGEPVRLWTFVRAALAGMGFRPPHYLRDRLSGPMARGVAWLLHRLRLAPAESYSRAVCLTRTQTFSHGRASRDLGYRPYVPLDEGLRRALGDARPGTWVEAEREREREGGLWSWLLGDGEWDVGWADGGGGGGGGGGVGGAGGVRIREAPPRMPAGQSPGQEEPTWEAKDTGLR